MQYHNIDISKAENFPLNLPTAKHVPHVDEKGHTRLDRVSSPATRVLGFQEYQTRRERLKSALYLRLKKLRVF